MKVAEEKLLIICTGTYIRLMGDFSTETLQARREWNDVFRMQKEKTVKQEYSTQQCCLSEMKVRKNFPDKQELRDFISTSDAL
jgi:hypothetical protein